MKNGEKTRKDEFDECKLKNQKFSLDTRNALC